ncbi:MAG TPA: hypothetical protein VEI97_04770, partial [bacterium]|nr:hypothetical protein [bacterium]
RIWDVDAAFTNLTQYTAFGPWAVFYNLNGNTILDQDGFATLERGGDGLNYPGAGQVKPVVAFAKDEDRRMWVGGATHTEHVRIQWPEGATSFNGLRFYIDASFPNARQEPIVERLMLVGQGADRVLGATVKDWQQNTRPLDVRVFGSGLPAEGLPMVAGEGDLYSVAVPTGAEVPLVVRARDSAGYHFENAVGGSLIVVGNHECEPGYHNLVGGQESSILEPLETVIRNAADFAAFWAQHHPNSQPPVINFECYDAYIVLLGDKPTGGYEIGFGLHPGDRGSGTVHYKWIAPGEGCQVPPHHTQPWRIWVGPKLSHLVEFVDHMQVHECGTGALRFRTIFKGITPAGEFPATELLINDADTYHQILEQLSAPATLPPVNFEHESVLLVSQGTQLTSGHMACITHVAGDPPPAPGTPLERVLVDWDAITPHETCPVNQVVNTPVHIGAVPKVPEAIFERHNRIGEPCEPHGECERFEVLRDTQERGTVEGFKLAIRNGEDWADFWAANFPNEPRPAINFETRMVIAIGLPPQQTTGRNASIECIAQTSSGVRVDWVDHFPGQGCAEPAQTRPTLVVVTDRLQGEVHFERHEVQEPPCPNGECLPMADLVPGDPANFKTGPYRLLINGPDAYEAFWHEAFPNEPPRPSVNFEEFSVIAIGLASHDNKVGIECVRQTSAGVEITYVVVEPGEGCPPFVNRHYAVVRVPKVQGEPHWLGREIQGQPCNEPECLPMQSLLDGTPHNFKAGAYQLLINGPDAFEAFWHEAFPNEPPRPAVNFEEFSVVAIGVANQGHKVAVECVRQAATGPIINYSVMVPGANCEPFVNRYYAIVKVHKVQGEPIWEGREIEGEPCDPGPGECLPMANLLNSTPHNFKQGPYTLLINDLAGFEVFWHEAFPNEPPRPAVNFEEFSVIAIGLDNQAKLVTIDCVVQGTAGPVVEFTVVEPGAGCEPFENRYYTVVRVPKVQGQAIWRPHVVSGEPCEPPPPGDCQDLHVLTDSPQGEEFQPGTRLIDTQGGLDEYFLARYGREAPDVNFEELSVIAINTGVTNV